YLGALPFVLGLLFFWADMSRNPFARQHVVEAALGVSVLFVWMKFWQAVFAREMRAQISGAPAEPLKWSAVARIVFAQTALQPTGFLVLPLAAIPALPFAWAYAFYQNLTALGGESEGSLRETTAKCVRDAMLWPRQNHLLLGFMGLFGAFVFVNVCVVCGLTPSLLKMLFGIETVFSRSGWAMLNTTFFAAMFGIAYLCVDPILKTIYTLRCFYGDSVKSGADLKADLSRFAHQARHVTAAVVLAVMLLCGASASATEPETPAQSPAPTRSIPPEQLNRAIEEVIHERKYTWRMPRERETETEQPKKKGLIGEFIEKVFHFIGKCLKAVLEFIARIIQKLFGQMPQVDLGNGSGRDPRVLIRVALAIAAALIIGAVGVLLYRLWRKPRRKLETAMPLTAQPAPDLTDENIGADQLPEDGWTKLARDLIARGEFRLAMRAFYLANLAHLAERNLIGLARFKSNRDYERELHRRAHAIPTLLPTFAENLSAFERVWYGTHAATAELVSRFAANVERMKTAA
ncbi:MAG: DUF4129 domain-containing protein, partial [Verrucomicrobia bacterium]